MDYSRIYNQLISKRQNIPPPENVYCEKHHIIPKCLKGTDDKSNIVKLTAREHYIAHLLLAKIYNTYGLYSAVIYMQTGLLKNRKFKFNSSLYQKIREEFANKLSQKMKGKNKGKTPWNKGKKCKSLSEETRQKISEANKGRIRSEETKNKISESLKGNKNMRGKHLSEDAKQKLSAVNKGKNTWSKTLHWYNNGIKNVFVRECPEGFVKGRLKKTKIES